MPPPAGEERRAWWYRDVQRRVAASEEAMALRGPLSRQLAVRLKGLSQGMSMMVDFYLHRHSCPLCQPSSARIAHDPSKSTGMSNLYIYKVRGWSSHAVECAG